MALAQPAQRPVVVLEERQPEIRSLYQHILRHNDLHDDDNQNIEQPAAPDDDVNSNQAVNDNQSLFNVPARANRNQNISNRNRNRNQNQTTHIRDARPARQRLVQAQLNQAVAMRNL